MATPHLTPEEVAKLRSLVAQLEQFDRTRPHEDTVPIHREFHSTIYNKCGSTTLIRWINELYNQFPKSLRRITRIKEPAEEYRRIVEAMEAGDAELAGKLMSEHLENGGRMAVKRYAEKLSSRGEESSVQAPDFTDVSTGISMEARHETQEGQEEDFV
ncbi:MAG: FCD domain-containing protein [Candidatus Eisenbacteria bacterium]|nr:FCD domain-containing protein [Candidatus Eisenbacteria bacterium]